MAIISYYFNSLCSPFLGSMPFLKHHRVKNAWQTVVPFVKETIMLAIVMVFR